MSKIINGTVALISKFSFFAAIILQKDPHRWTFCGGSYLGEKMIATAAHCVASVGDSRQTNIHVYFGLSEIDFTKPPVLTGIPVRQLSIHPDWNQQTLSHDVALLQLEHAPTGAGILRLPSGPELDHPGLDFTILGFGKTSYSDSWGVHTLWKGTVSIMDPYDFPHLPIDGSQLLAGDPAILSANTSWEGHVDACQGDSGGPLFYKEEGDASGILVGIISGGVGCGLRSYPGIYAKISNHLSWIHEVLLRNGSSS